MNSVLLLSLFLAAAQPSAEKQPRVFLLDAKQLLHEREIARMHPDQPDDVLRAARAEAEKAMKPGPFSVTQKSIMPPSGNKHDYMSWAPYFWPNPDTPNHLPYIRRDGEHNPEIKQIPDHDNMSKMCSTASALAIGYYVSGKEAYAERATLLLRDWFVCPTI